MTAPFDFLRISRHQDNEKCLNFAFHFSNDLEIKIRPSEISWSSRHNPPRCLGVDARFLQIKILPNYSMGLRAIFTLLPEYLALQFLTAGSNQPYDDQVSPYVQAHHCIKPNNMQD